MARGSSLLHDMEVQKHRVGEEGTNERQVPLNQQNLCTRLPASLTNQQVCCEPGADSFYQK